MDKESPKNRIEISKNIPLLNKSKLMMLSSNNLSKPKSNILQKIELEDIVAQNNRLKNKINYLNDENTKIKTRLTVAERQKNKLLNQNQFFSTESKQIRPYSSKKLNEKIFNPRSSVKITKTSQSLPIKKNLKIENYMKETIREYKEKNDNLRKQIMQLKRKMRFTRINELQAQNYQLLSETMRLTQQIQINKHNNFNNLNPLISQINELKTYLSQQVQIRKKIQYQLRKNQGQKKQLLQKLQQSQEKIKKLQKNNNMQKKQYQQTLQKLREQININNRVQFNKKNQEYDNIKNAQYVSSQISTINKLKKQNTQLKNEINKQDLIIKSHENQLKLLKKTQKNDNQKTFKNQIRSPQKNKNNQLDKQDKNIIQKKNISDKIAENNKNQLENDQIKSNGQQNEQGQGQQFIQLQRQMKSQNKKKLEQLPNDKHLQNQKSNSRKNMFSDSQLQKIMNEDQSQQNQKNNNQNQQTLYQNTKSYEKKQEKPKIQEKQDDYENENYENEQQQQSQEFKKHKKIKNKDYKQHSQKSAQHQQKSQNQSDEQILFKKQLKQQKQQKKKSIETQNKQIKLLKATITYRLKAYHYTYQNFANDIQNSGTKNFQIDNLKGFLSDEPFMLNEHQFQILISQMNVKANKVSSEILIKKMKKFIGQISFRSQQQQTQQIQNLKSKLIYNQKQIYQKLGKLVNSISRKYLVPILQNFNFSKQQIELFISQSMLVSTDCSKINCKKAIQMLKYEKNGQKDENQGFKHENQNQEEYQQIYGE